MKIVYSVYGMGKKPKIKFKNVLKAFGGAGIYMDKQMLNHLQLSCGDEIKIELAENTIILSKPLLSECKVNELLQRAKRMIK